MVSKIFSDSNKKNTMQKISFIKFILFNFHFNYSISTSISIYNIQIVLFFCHYLNFN